MALIQNTTEPNPLLVQDEGGAGLLGVTGEFLSFSDANLELQPRLAESWEPNADGSVWTFAIRQGVTFHDGTPLTANDVVQTFEKLINPDGGSANAQSALGGVLSPGGIEAPDDATVVFNLDAPNGNFPTLVSSANYNAIIIPADLDPNEWGQTFMGTGPFKFDSFTPQVGLTVVRNDAYWGTPALPDGLDVKLYADEAAMVLGLQGDEVDFVEHFSVAGGKALLEDPNVQVIVVRTATHRQLHMRTDMEPFTDKRVRQAIAMSIDRQALVEGLWEGQADLGNDSPFAPLYPSTDTSVGQRVQDIELAKQLMADAGMGDGFEVQLDTWDGFEIPDLAQLVKNYAEQIGVTINLNITDAGTYYGDGVFGSSTWLDSVMGITDYGHRPVPNVFLTASLHGDSRTGRLELRALPEPDVRPACDGLRRGARPRFPTRGGKADPGAPPGRDAGRVRLLLQLPLGGQAEPTGSDIGGDRTVRPLAGELHVLSRDRHGGRGSERAPAAHRIGLQGQDGTVPPQAARPRRHHAVPAQRDRVLRHPGPAGERRPPHPRARSRTRPPSTISTRSSAPTGRCSRSTATGSRASSGATSASRSRSACRSTTSSATRSLHSLKLAALAFVIVVPLAILGGVIAALKRDRPTDRVITIGGHLADRDPRVRHRDHPHPRLRALGRPAAGQRERARRERVLHAAQVPHCCPR